MSDLEAFARIVMDRCDILAEYSEEPDCLVRRFASGAMQQVNEVVAKWMRAAGMSVRQDAIGNLIGRYEADHPKAKTLLLGSHLDTVRNAGKYDGSLGVMLALICIERLHLRQQHLPFAIEVLGFADEEGLRYHCAYLGSKAIAGAFDSELLHLIDSDGIAMADAIRAAGGDPEHIAGARRDAHDLLGYYEVHIEQGPVLETLNTPVGIVSAIAGQSRISVSFNGEAGHAGTVPMGLRRDALCAAAEFILSVERYARNLPELVATVGQTTVLPGASNVIPGQVTLSLDVRHQSDILREQACAQFRAQADTIATERGISACWAIVQENCSVLCAPDLSNRLRQAIESLGYSVLSLPSGAGHDAVALSKLTDVAMLFVRCQGGISHHPAEAVALEDVTVAIDVLEHTLLLLAQERGQL